MLSGNRKPLSIARGMGAHRQRGVVLMIALIMLVAMTLAGLALVRSVDTTNIIAGNLAFQQAATNYGDVGTNAAVAWLVPLASGSALNDDDLSNGYSSSIKNPVNQSWDNFWITTLVPEKRVFTMPTDAATGNTVSYAIQRMCSLNSAPPGQKVPKNYCAVSTVSAQDVRHRSGEQAYSLTNQVYFRITSRIVGPRNTVSYIQTVVAI